MTALARLSQPLSIELKEAQISRGSITGLASVFGNVDAYGDVVEPGAFSKTLDRHRDEGTMPVMLWSHDPTKPIGRWDDIRETRSGLEVEGQLNIETDHGRAAFEHLRAGDVSGLSIGYAPVEHHRSADGKHRVLSEVDLMEISVVAMPANRRARVREVKQFTSRADVREFLRSTGLPRGAAEKLATGGWPALRGSDLTQIETRTLTDSVRKVAALFKGSSK